MVSSADELRAKLHDHLALWGLRRFASDDAYFFWQRQVLSPQELSLLHDRVEQRRLGSPADEIAFYDTTADARILPVLYSQRFDYYAVLGPLVASRLDAARTVLDFGCGVGILTTFYARQFPEKCFVGIDRSPASIARAQEQAAALGLRNVQFECLDLAQHPCQGTYEAIIATHALVQAEQDPGIPSRDWTTFERVVDAHQQRLFETRTGLAARLDRLCTSLAPRGRLLVFEKTRQLARRVPFQRALAARGLALTEPPQPVRYRLVEEVSEDGPFYVTENGASGTIPWDESPEPDEGRPFNSTLLTAAPPRGDEPLYENHHSSAQEAWQRLSRRAVLKETTRVEADGRQLHVELGQAEEGIYLYCANTFDQRQLVIVEPARAALVETYYREIVGGEL
jgi:SAM-dependent methyltransferase